VSSNLLQHQRVRTGVQDVNAKQDEINQLQPNEHEAARKLVNETRQAEAAANEALHAKVVLSRTHARATAAETKVKRSATEVDWWRSEVT
jgi:hypothetical protein